MFNELQIKRLLKLSEFNFNGSTFIKLNNGNYWNVKEAEFFSKEEVRELLEDA